MLIFSAPSGAGKTSIVKGVMSAVPGLSFSVSACSRPRREGEVNGVDYYFMTPAEFRRKIEQGAFLEWEEVYPGNYYGTLKSEVERIWKAGSHVVFDVDVAGGMHIKEGFPGRSLGIFVMPPSLEELENRLIKRQTESQESLRERLGKASREMDFAGRFDHVLINDNLDRAIEEAIGLVRSFIEKPFN